MATSKKRSRTHSQGQPLNRFRVSLSLILIIAGAALLSVSYKEKLDSSSDQNLGNSGNEIVSERKLKPSKLYIPTFNKSLDVYDGSFEKNRWVVSQKGVSFMTSSALPGEEGNAVMYGHNRKSILGDLKNIKKDEYILVILSDQSVVKYKISDTKEIQPTQVEILNQTKDATLTIYTCSGYLDESRFVVIAKKV